MVKVICDTSFLMILASTNVKNISNLDTEIGTIEFMVPDMVIEELEKISKRVLISKKKNFRLWRYKNNKRL